MRVNGFIVLSFFFCFIQIIYANTEKLILQVQSTDDIQCDERLFLLNKYQSARSLTAPWTQLQGVLIPRSEANKTTADWYQLSGLTEGSSYEIRISYPAITPADFELNIIQRCLIKDQYLYLLQVTANYTGVSQVKKMDHQPVIYHIVLENLYFGFLFYQVYKLVIAIVIVLLLGQFIFIPYIKHLIIQKTVKIE